MRLRDLCFEIHKYAGLASFVFLIIAGVTGCVLVFRADLDARLNPDLYEVAQRPVLAPADLALRLEAARPGLQVVELPLRARPGKAVMITVAPRAGAPLAYDQVFVDPADGAVLGQRLDRAGWSRRGLMRGVYDLHSGLIAGAPGRWIMGIVAAVWLISNLIGVYLTLPQRAPFWARWRPLWTVSLRARLPRQLLDLHRASGLWLVPLMTLLALTSVALNFYAELAQPMAQALSPARPSPFDDGQPTLAPGHRPALGWGEAVALAEADAPRRAPGWRPVNALYAPAVGVYGLALTRSGRDDYAGLGPIRLYYQGDDGRFVFRDDPGRDSLGRAALRALYPLHSGEVFGWPTRLLVFVLGAATVEMAATGLYLWLKRR